jgi:hypothetical protein
MNFEQNAVESDYDEHYDSRQLIIDNGRAVYVDDTEDQGTSVYSDRQARVSAIPIIMEPSSSMSSPPRTRRRPVQLPRCAPDEEKINKQEVSSPALVVSKGGWNIQHIKQPSFTTLSKVEAQLSSEVAGNVSTPRPRTSSPRPVWNRANKWRNITSEVLTCDHLVEYTPPAAPVMPDLSCTQRTSDTRRPHRDDRSDISQHVRTPVPRAPPTAEDDEKRQNTKICRFVEITFKKTSSGLKTTESNKCRRPNCTYAHTMSNWKPRPCRFQTGCRSLETCPFKHENETRESYYERTKNMS